jgi:hypothetical protein
MGEIRTTVKGFFFCILGLEKVPISMTFIPNFTKICQCVCGGMGEYNTDVIIEYLEGEFVSLLILSLS